jgi:hypothetical protein
VTNYPRTRIALRRGKKVGKYGLVATAVTAGAVVGGAALIGGSVVV